MSGLPEVWLSSAESQAISELCAEVGPLAALEADTLGARLIRQRAAKMLATAKTKIVDQWQRRDHVVVRGVGVSDDGATGLVLATALLPTLKSYRGEQVVKHFRMSPWTKALSHTLAAGTFHSDINTAPVPPAVTQIQCLDPDPGAPAFGQVRVARVVELIEKLELVQRRDVLRFLTSERITMVNETSPSGWSGNMLDKGTIRFHSESLRAGQRRTGGNPPNLEELLKVIHEAALTASEPINLAAGDVLLVSNHRALHQRGACTVRFQKYPREFLSRRIAVLHALDEPV